MLQLMLTTLSDNHFTTYSCSLVTRYKPETAPRNDLTEYILGKDQRLSDKVIVALESIFYPYETFFLTLVCKNLAQRNERRREDEEDSRL